MVYEASGHKSSCIDSITAGSFVIYDDEQWRIARPSGEFVDLYRKYEAPVVVPIKDVNLTPCPDETEGSDDEPVVMADGGFPVGGIAGEGPIKDELSRIEDADVEPGDRVEYDGREWTFHEVLCSVKLVADDGTVEFDVEVRELDPVNDDGRSDPYAEYDPERHGIGPDGDGDDLDPDIVTDGGVPISDVESTLDWTDEHLPDGYAVGSRDDDVSPRTLAIDAAASLTAGRSDVPQVRWDTDDVVKREVYEISSLVLERVIEDTLVAESQHSLVTDGGVDMPEDDDGAITGTVDDWHSIPEELKQIDRWMMWSAAPGIPRRPHWKGDFSVSYDDSDDWHTFDEAVEAAQEKDEWGIGFVTGDDVAAIDVDGCAKVDDDGGKHPKEWVPTLSKFKRAATDGEVYVEWSPSETGFHIPVKNFEKPEFWTDLSVENAEHEGIDVLTGQFVTVTGQSERDFDGGVVEHTPHIDLWLLEAEENITALNGGNDLDNAGDGDGWSPDNEWLDEDDIRDALSHLDADCGYHQWRNIGFAVAEFFYEEDGSGDEYDDEEAQEKAVELFKSWSESADEKWDASAEQQAERIIEESWDRIPVQDDPVTVGTLIAYAKNAGWSMPAPPKADCEEVDWDAVEEARLNAEWRSEKMYNVRDDVHSSEWTNPDEDSDKDPEFIGVNVVEPIGPDDDVIVTLWEEQAHFEHRTPAQSTVDAKLQGREAGRVINAEPIHLLAHRIDTLYIECLNAQARAAAAQRLMQAMEFVTTGGADDQTIYCYNPVKGKFEGDGREVIRSVIEAVCPGRASGHEKREIVGKIADRTREDGSEAFEPRGEFDNEEHDYRVVGNGILRLPTLQRDGAVSEPKLLDFDPDLRAKQRLPVDWNPDADTLEIDEWLDEITERPEDRATIEEAIGNILLPDYRHPKIVMMYGSGRNSKGVILDVIVEMCGGVDSPNVAGNRLEDLAQNQFRTAMLDDAVVNVNGDIGQRKIQYGSKLKELTGGDAQEGESKHEDSETFRNTAKLWFAANSPPLPPESGEAWQERWLPIHLPFQFLPDPDPEDPYQKPQENGIKDRLTRDDNLEAILVRAVEGLGRLEAQGDVSLTESPEDRLDSYEQDADPIGRVETDLLKPAHGASSKAEKYVPNGAMYDAYKSLASDDGVDAVPRTDFFRLLEDRVEDIPFDKSRPRAPDSVDDDRVYSMTGVAFRDEAVEHLSEYWLNHPWVNIEGTSNDDGETVNDEGEKRSPHFDDVISLSDAANADSYVTVEVDVDYKNLQGSNLIEITVHDDSGTMRDIVAKDRGNDELDIVDEVQEGDTVRFERLKPGADLKVRPMTDVTVVNRETDETVNDGDVDSTRSLDLINEPIGDSEGDSQSQQEAARADGGSDEGTDPSTSQKDRVESVKSIIDTMEDPADDGVLVEDVLARAEDVGIDRGKVEHELEQLKLKGDVYEPATDRLRTT